MNTIGQSPPPQPKLSQTSMKNTKPADPSPPTFSKTMSPSEIDLSLLPAFLRVLLITDGTVTNILEAFFWQSIQVENLGQRQIFLREPVALLDAESGDGVLEREVRLIGVHSNTPYVFARSLIRLEVLPEALRESLLQGKIGIGELLRNSNLETYRELIEIGERQDPVAEQSLGKVDLPLIYRLYRISLDHQPAMLIAEYFPQEVYQ